MIDPLWAESGPLRSLPDDTFHRAMLPSSVAVNTDSLSGENTTQLTQFV